MIFLFFGASRLTVLTVNYLHLANVCSYWRVRLVGKTAHEQPAIGLYLAFGLAFGSGPFWFGSMVDYRLDFSAGCMFGVFVSAFLSFWGVPVVEGIASGWGRRGPRDVDQIRQLTLSCRDLRLTRSVPSLEGSSLVAAITTMDYNSGTLLGSGILAAAVALPAIFRSTALPSTTTTSFSKERR